MVGPDYPLIFDNGIRDGEDIVKALALGADFVMVGRPYVCSGRSGEQGIAHLTELINKSCTRRSHRLARRRERADGSIFASTS